MVMKKSLLLISAMIILEAIAGCSSPINSKPPSIQSASDSTVEVVNAEPFSYEDYAKVLQNYVSDRGLVNYEGLQANRQSARPLQSLFGRGFSSKLMLAGTKPNKLLF